MGESKRNEVALDDIFDEMTDSQYSFEDSDSSDYGKWWAFLATTL